MSVFCSWMLITVCKIFIFCLPCILLWFLVNDQLEAQFFSMYLFQFSTCFEQPRAHHQKNQLYHHSIWCMSLCVGDRFVWRSESSFPTCTRNGHTMPASCTALSTHTTTWNICCHNIAELITMYFYWLILQKCNFSQAQCKLPEDGPSWPKHVGVNIRYLM